MSNYIDERPLEQIVQDIVLDGKHEDYIDTIVQIVSGDEESHWRIDAFKGDTTIYEYELNHLQGKRSTLQLEYDQADKQYTGLLTKLADLDKDSTNQDSTVDDTNEDYNDDVEEGEDYYKGKAAKIKVKPVGMKPAEIVAKRKKNEIAKRNFKASLATIQDDLRTIIGEIREIDEKIKKYEFENEIAVKVLRSLRRIVKHYKECKDLEFVKKGAYFVKDYSEKLKANYIQSQ